MRRTKIEAAQTRAAILDAAETLFFEKGVATTTLSQIAAEAGLTRGAIYWHFENKIQLFREMQERARLPQEAFFYDETRSEPPSIGELYEHTIEALGFLASDPRTQRVLTILLFHCEYVGEMKSALRRRDDADQRMRTEISRIFCHALKREGYPDGAADPQSLGTAYYCSVSGLINEWLKSEHSFDLVEVGRRLLSELVADHLETAPMKVVMANEPRRCRGCS